MEKSYQPDAIEGRWYQQWEEKGYFSPNQTGQSYSIMLPPPNVTGNLHMGHAFQDTIMDVLSRFHRMQGDSALWQPGMDHAGIATQMVVERQLAMMVFPVTILAVTSLLRRFGTGRVSPVVRSQSRCAGWVHQWIGNTIDLPWMRTCHVQ